MNKKTEKTSVKDSTQIDELGLTIGRTIKADEDSNDETKAGNIYKKQLEQISQDKLTTFHVNFFDIKEFDSDLSDQIQENFYRIEPYLRENVEQVREMLFPKKIQEGHAEEKKHSWISFSNLVDTKKLRHLRTDQIGKLITVSGTVTRTSDVKPELFLGTFICLECGNYSDKVEQQFKYTEPIICQNPSCSNRNKWQLDLDQSVFIDWQRVRVQENSNEIPPGSMPRSIDVIMRNSSTVEKAKAGDRCLFTGTLLVVPDVHAMFSERVESRQVQNPEESQNSGSGKTQKKGTWAPNEGLSGLKVLGVRELTYKMAFLCNHVQSIEGKSFTQEESTETLISTLSPQELSKIVIMSKDKEIFSKLSKSIAPNVYGHENVKKGILLMLFGGVHKTTIEGINLRGDINVCIVGDPSTSKSQFLKYVSNLLPRSVYTSGKASTAAGLTASVHRDSERGEFTIEAGALMLADNGVCCIDEFDKMDIKDQVAIHEAMEQQTISIAKAGIRATLNARASILAAANPIGGRYNPKKTLKANLGISPAIMSRFDLFFIVQDECNEDVDKNIAKHILSVHRNKIEEIKPDFSIEEIKLYINYCKTLKPVLSDDAKKILVESYRKLRQADKNGVNSYRITVRQLESLIRLSEALAKLYTEEKITPEHVKEAVKLLKMSICKVDKDPITLTQDESYWEKRRKENQKNIQKSLQDELKNRLTIKKQALKKEKEILYRYKEDIQDLDSQINEYNSQDIEETKELKKTLISECKKEISELEKEIEEIESKIGNKDIETIEEDPNEEPVTKKKKAKKLEITFDMYSKISKIMVSAIRQNEEKNSKEGIKKKDIINHYIDSLENPGDEKSVSKEIKIAKKIIEKLFLQDNILIDLDFEKEDLDDMEHLFTVNPNYNFDD